VRFGVLAGVPLPPGREPVAEADLERLHPRELELARAERGRRQIEIVGGRLAFREAAAALGVEVGAFPLLSDSNRAPLAPPGLTVSLTHKEDLAIALIAHDADGAVGVDLEGGARDRSAIMTRVCRPEEVAHVRALPEAARWPNVMARFAVKEAIYKSIAPRLGRFFGFQAARVDLGDADQVGVTMFLEPGDPSFRVEAELLRLDAERIVALVRSSALG
jgi:4'-phosphopantetheinyl transferase EntD